MAGAERFSLIIDSKTTGTAEVEKLTLALSKVANVAENAGKKTETAAKSANDSARGLASSIQSAISDPLGTAKSKVEEFAFSLGKFGGISVGVVAGLGAIGAAAFEIVAGAGKAAEGLANFADRTGLTISQASKLSAMAKIAGVDIGALEASSRVLATALEDTGGAGAKAQKALREMGIAMYDAKGNEREMGQVTLELLEKLSNIPNNTERIALANAALGRGAKEILPLISNYADLKRAVEELGIGVDTGLTKQLAKADDEIDKLELALGRLKKQTAGAIAPIVVPIVLQLTSLVGGKKNRDLLQLGAQASNPVQMLGTLLWQSLGPDLSPTDPVPMPKPPQSVPPNALVTDDVFRSISAENFRWNASLEGLQKRREQLEKDIFAAHQKLIEPNFTDMGERAKLVQQRVEEERELTKVKAAIEAINKAEEARKKLAADILELEKKASERGLDPISKAYADLADLVKRNPKISSEQLSRATSATEQIAAAELKKIIDKGANELVAAVQELANEGEKILRDGLDDFNKRTLNAVRENINLTQSVLPSQRAQMRAEGAIRINDATAALNGPFAQAVNLQSDLSIRNKLAQDLFDIESRRIASLNPKEVTDLDRQNMMVKARGELEKAQFEAQLDYQTRLLELEKQRQDEIRQSAGELYNALKAGGAGIREFITGQADVWGKTVFQNFAVLMSKNLTGKFAIPGVKADSFAGQLLANTPFGPDPLKAAGTIQLSAANIQLDAARTMLGAVSGLSGGTTANGARSILGGIPGLFGGTTASGISTFGGTDILGNPLGSIPGGYDPTASIAFGSNVGGSKGASALTKGVGYGAAIAAGGFGVYSGIRQGGAQGFMTAAGSALGTAAMLDPEPISKAILAVAALGTGLVSALLGNPKQKRADQLQADAAGRAYTAPTGTSYFADNYGNQVDYTYQGTMRPMIVYQTNIHAIDTQSSVEFLERNGPAVASAITKTVWSGNGEEMLGTFRRAL